MMATRLFHGRPLIVMVTAGRFASPSASTTSGGIPSPSWAPEARRRFGTHDLLLPTCAPAGSAELLDADQVARGIAEGAVADPVRLLDRLLDDLGAVGLQPLEGAVEVAGGKHDPAVGALGHHLGDGAALVVGDAGVGGRRRQEDGRARLVFGADRDPAHLAASDVVADLEAEHVAVEGQGGIRIVVREEARVNGDVHGGHASCGSVTRASRFLTGLVTCFATHDGIPAVAAAAWRR